MKNIIKILGKMLFVIIFSMMFFSSASASEISKENNYDSMYIYNALENKASFTELVTGSNLNKREELATRNEPSEDITQELQNIIEKQKTATEEIDKAMDDLQNRNKIKTFLLGNKLGVLKFQMVQIIDFISILEDLYLKAEDSESKIQINMELESSKEEKNRVESFILEQEDDFNLFGMLIGMI